MYSDLVTWFFFVHFEITIIIGFLQEKIAQLLMKYDIDEISLINIENSLSNY